MEKVRTERFWCAGRDVSNTQPQASGSCAVLGSHPPLGRFLCAACSVRWLSRAVLGGAPRQCWGRGQNKHLAFQAPASGHGQRAQPGVAQRVVPRVTPVFLGV